MTQVLVFGVFDFFHPGHLGFLRMAAKYGDSLIVSVARDSFVHSYKKKTPVFNEDERLSRILSLPFVESAVLSDSAQGSYSVIKNFNPSVICFGHDQNKLEEHCENWLALNGKAVKTIKLPVVRFVKKDYAFINDLKRASGRLSGFDAAEIKEAEDRGIKIFTVYNRSDEIAAFMFFEDSEVSLFYPLNKGADVSDIHLAREAAIFCNYYWDLERDWLKITFPGRAEAEMRGLADSDFKRDLSGQSSVFKIKSI